MKTNNPISDMKNTNNIKGNRQDEKFVNDNLKKKISGSKASKLPFIGDVITLYKMMKDPNVDWGFKSMAVGALFYFIFPADAVPDVLPVLGYLDDAGVVTAAVAYLKSRISGYDS